MRDGHNAPRLRSRGICDPDSNDFITIEIEADGFLYNMVRAIVGTLVEVGRGSRPESWPGEVLRALDRRVAGPTAPPQGLAWRAVQYTSRMLPSGWSWMYSVGGRCRENTVPFTEYLSTVGRRVDIFRCLLKLPLLSVT